MKVSVDPFNYTGVASIVASTFPKPSLRHYAKGKLLNDPIYQTVATELQGSNLPMLDFGCGIGLLALSVHLQGYGGEIVGVDRDEEKIAIACDSARQLQAPVVFRTADARAVQEFSGNVALIDVLQYMAESDHPRVLHNAAQALAPDGVLLIRSGVRDGSWRAKMSYLLELGIRGSGWIRGEAIRIPTLDEIRNAFSDSEFQLDVRPQWGRTPFNNYLFVIRRR